MLSLTDQRIPNRDRASPPLSSNLPSRRLEKGYRDTSLLPSGSSLRSISAPSTATLGSTTRRLIVPIDVQSSAPFQTFILRVWGAVAGMDQTSGRIFSNYLTLTEATRQAKEHQGEHHQGAGNVDHAASSSTSGTKPDADTKSSSEEEPAAKTISALTKSDSWMRYDHLLLQSLTEDDEFLSAGVIEFADGAVVVAPALAKTIQVLKRAEPQLPTATQKPAAHDQGLRFGPQPFGNRNRSGPPRRDNYGCRDPSSHFGISNRECSMPYSGNNFGFDRRVSQGRQSHGSDRFSAQPPRDYELISRSTDGLPDHSGALAGTLTHTFTQN
ncbi:hypothetical protein BG015_006959 [Linnemannia schmuckeri]|uniref:Uncharacterized protein n=1 Tax=Linnemannia schmuckeri TaxID=64567 RepID=A0A9P5VBS1_9FUNG|nr:hypothetical protein BG015_006959 [Linnemannia schmuckeri]